VNERLLVTGGSGLLGSNIARTAAQDFEVYATYHSRGSRIPKTKFVQLDIRDKQQVGSVLKRIEPDLVIHAAALVNVDYCETHPEESWEINVEGTENVALASKEVNAKMIFISTDSVFDGEKGMYGEEDVPHPLNTYARTKLEGERRALHCLPDSTVVRTAFYGWSLHNGLSLAEWVVGSLRQGETINLFTDVFFSPILATNLVEILLELHQRHLNGIYHIGGSERCNKYTFGQEIASIFWLDKDCIQPCSISEVGLKAPRPADASLNVDKISKVASTRLLGVEEGISRFRDLEYSCCGDSK
jgi:dTDP-4-dehydrorhamnose reductase